MSTVFYNLIFVTGARRSVSAFCADARRRVRGELARAIGAKEVPWSFERLFELHRSLGGVCGEPPCDAWHYRAETCGVVRWSRFSRARFRLEVKNYQIHELIQPLSEFYPGLCFVNAELCLDDSTVMSAFAHRGAGATWDLPEGRQGVHWRRAARARGLGAEEAYDNDDARNEAENGMLLEAAVHWNSRTRLTLIRMEDALVRDAGGRGHPSRRGVPTGRRGVRSVVSPRGALEGRDP